MRLLITNPLIQRSREQITALDQRRAEGRLPWGQSEKVRCDTHLPIAIATCSDADHRDGQTLPNASSEFSWNVFEHQGEAADGLEDLGLLENPLLTALIFRLSSIPEMVNGLRR